MEADGLNAPEDAQLVLGLHSEFQANNAAIRREAAGPYQPLAEDLLASPHMGSFVDAVEDALVTGEVPIGEVMAATTPEDLSDLAYRAFSSRVASVLDGEADEVAADADRLQSLAVGLGLLLVAVTGAVTLLLAWVIVRSLRALAADAVRMAQRLPTLIGEIAAAPLGADVAAPEAEPIRAGTRDEIGDVAATLNEVQDTALALAVDQALLRRSTADCWAAVGERKLRLLARQLEVIEGLENQATLDGPLLRGLYKADHLATQMRRNAESMLVLAGQPPPRRLAWPVPMSQVIRSALGEVQDYERVRTPAVVPVDVVGEAVADLAHLLAELIDNALGLSPVDKPVTVYGQGDARSYIVYVIDQRVGVSNDVLAQANRRLAGTEAFTQAPSKDLGHHVAGQLAACHGIGVTLHRSGDPARRHHPTDGTTPEPARPREGGITAVIHLPSHVLSEAGAAPPDTTTGTAPPFSAAALAAPGPREGAQ